MSNGRGSSILRWGLAALFIGAAAIQATHREFFSALVPQSLREYSSLLQGVMTAALAFIGLSFLIPRLQMVGRWATTIMLLGTLPAAIDQVRRPEQTDELGIPRPVVVLRIPAQVIVVVAAWYTTRKSQSGR